LTSFSDEEDDCDDCKADNSDAADDAADNGANRCGVGGLRWCGGGRRCGGCGGRACGWGSDARAILRPNASTLRTDEVWEEDGSPEPGVGEFDIVDFAYLGATVVDGVRGGE
jgi:hypothetical protein